MILSPGVMRGLVRIHARVAAVLATAALVVGCTPPVASNTPAASSGSPGTAASTLPAPLPSPTLSSTGSSSAPTASPSLSPRSSPSPAGVTAFSCSTGKARVVTIARSSALADGRDPLGGAGPLTAVASGYQDLEGARWLPWDGILVYADRKAGTLHELTPPSSVSVCRASVGTLFGLALGPSGRLLAGTGSQVVRFGPDPAPEVLATAQKVGRAIAPNGVAARADGTIFVTSSPQGAAASVFRMASSGAISILWEPADAAPHNPNGIALSADESTLYVGYFTERVVRAFSLSRDGSVASSRVFAQTGPQTDGVILDQAGNVFVATQQGVQVFAPNGSLWGTISVPQPAFKLAFGGVDGTTLYITTAATLYRIQLTIPGIIGA